jgi:hypothetical protein
MRCAASWRCLLQIRGGQFGLAGIGRLSQSVRQKTRDAMKGWKWPASLLLVGAVSTFAGDIEAADVPTLKCEVGPVTKTYGDTDWLVYSCEDQKSFAVVAAPNNPARPYFFFYLHSDNGYKLHGEGEGDKQLTDAAFNELSELTEDQIATLLDETRKASIRK